jgi:hypothetical protein
MMHGECRRRSRFLDRCLDGLDAEGRASRCRPLAAPSLAARPVCVAASNRGRTQHIQVCSLPSTTPKRMHMVRQCGGDNLTFPSYSGDRWSWLSVERADNVLNVIER